MGAHEELVKRLQGFTGLTDLVGTRIHVGGVRPQSDGLPAVTVQWVGGGQRESAMGQDTGDVRALLQADAWSKRVTEGLHEGATMAGIVEVSEQVRKALQRWPVRDRSYAGDLQDVFLDSTVDLYEDDVGVHHRAMTFAALYMEVPT